MTVEFRQRATDAILHSNSPGPHHVGFPNPYTRQTHVHSSHAVVLHDWVIQDRRQAPHHAVALPCQASLLSIVLYFQVVMVLCLRQYGHCLVVDGQKSKVLFGFAIWVSRRAHSGILSIEIQTSILIDGYSPHP